MTIFRKITLFLLSATISSLTYANVIELDAVNPDHCRQQLLQSKDELPIIAAYTSNQYDTVSQSFMEKFEVLAKEHREKTFFKWDAVKDIHHETQSLCLQQLGMFIPPSIILIGVAKEYNYNKEESFMTSPLRLEWSGLMTLADLSKFIDVSNNSNLKKNVLSRIKAQ